MVADAVNAEQNWRLLWSHATSQIVSALPAMEAFEVVRVAHGWGVRQPNNHRRGLLIHPTARDRDVGDLSLTVLGYGTQVIPRSGSDYVQYLATVSDVVETAVNAYLVD